MIRCINIDWLEVYCLEPLSKCLNANFFLEAGWQVESRPYGTRNYNEMFTLYTTDGLPFCEVRRSPKSTSNYGGIMDVNGCHIRLHNRACYLNNAVSLLRQFLDRYNYQVSRISRIDICLDFVTFDSGDRPNIFLTRYIKGRYSKINQSDFGAHAKDRWDGRFWNWAHWGSRKSQITTKLYNKTLELKESKHNKPYIKWAWIQAGYISDFDCTKTLADGSKINIDVWRLEFSISSSVKNWYRIEADGKENKIRSFRNTLDVYDKKEKLITVFASLVQHYFHFKTLIKDQEGNVRSKYDCPDKQLFRFSKDDTVLHIDTNKPVAIATQSHERDLQTLNNKLGIFLLRQTDNSKRKDIVKVQEYIKEDIQRQRLQNPYSQKDLLIMQQTINYHIQHPEADPEQLRQFLLSIINHGDSDKNLPF